MKLYRRKTRKIIYQLLFSKTFWVEKDVILDTFFWDNSWDFGWNVDMDFLNEIYSIVLENEKILISLIEKYAPKFDINKMPLHSTLAIFISIAEMFFLKEEMPAKVSINEAVEISKIFGDDSSKRIVNWVLNKIFIDSENIAKNIKDKDFLEKIPEKSIFN